MGGNKITLIDMQVYLCDHKFNKRADPKSAWHQALSKAFNISATNDNKAPSTHNAYKEDTTVIFAHSEYPESWCCMAAKADVKCQIVLVRSAGKQRVELTKKANIHGCFWSPNDFEKGTQPEIAKFIKQVNTGVKVEWSLLEAPRSEELLAFRLLCEAWLVQPDDEGNRKCNDFTINAPIKPESWFGPFDEKVVNGEAAERIAGQMGDAKDRVKEFLEEIIDGANLDGYSTHKKTVEDLLEKLIAEAQ